MPTTQSTKPIPSQWLAHVEQWRASGLTRSAYCGQHGITLHALAYWIQRHRAQSKATDTLTLIPAKVVAQPPAGLPSELILHCPNGSKLHLPGTTPAAWLGTLLSQLR